MHRGTVGSAGQRGGVEFQPVPPCSQLPSSRVEPSSAQFPELVESPVFDDFVACPEYQATEERREGRRQVNIDASGRSASERQQGVTGATSPANDAHAEPVRENNSAQNDLAVDSTPGNDSSYDDLPALFEEQELEDHAFDIFHEPGDHRYTNDETETIPEDGNMSDSAHSSSSNESDQGQAASDAQTLSSSHSSNEVCAVRSFLV